MSHTKRVVAVAMAAVLGSSASASIVNVSQTFFNNTASARTYFFHLSAQVASVETNGYMSGGISATLTDLNGNGAFLTSSGSNPVYTALVNDAAVQTLWNAPFNFTVGQFLSNSTAPTSFANIALPVGVPVDGTISVDLRFTLSAGDAVSISSTFVTAATIPASAPIALMASIGVTGFRRRRR